MTKERSEKPTEFDWEKMRKKYENLKSNDRCPLTKKEGKKLNKIIKNCPCEGCEKYKEVLYAPETAASTPSHQSLSWRARLAILGILGSAITVGIVGSRNTDGKPMRGENATTPENPRSEIIPEDPHKQIILDESWRTYAKKQNMNLEEIGEILFPLFKHIKEVLLKYYPPLPPDYRFRVTYSPQKDIRTAAHTTLPSRMYQIEKKNGAYQLVFKKKPGAHDQIYMTLHGTDSKSLSKTTHEFAHVFHLRLGIANYPFIDEGLAEFMQTEYDRQFGIPSPDDPMTTEYLEAFPELETIPARFYRLSDTDEDWIPLMEIQYRLGKRIFTDYEKTQPGFLKKWFTAIQQDNRRTRSAPDAPYPTQDEIMKIGENVSPGFYQKLFRNPNFQAALREKDIRLLKGKIQGNKLYIINIRFGKRTYPTFQNSKIFDVLASPNIQIGYVRSDGVQFGTLDLPGKPMLFMNMDEFTGVTANGRKFQIKRSFIKAFNIIENGKIVATVENPSD